MFKNLSEDFSWFVVGCVSFLLILLGAGLYDVHADNVREEQMKACVAAGKDWVRDGITSYYECK